MTHAEGGRGMTVKLVGRRLLIVLAVLVILTGTAFWPFRYVRPWLVVDDALQPARAISVPSNLVPYLTVNYIFAWTQAVDEPYGLRFSA